MIRPPITRARAPTPLRSGCDKIVALTRENYLTDLSAPRVSDFRHVEDSRSDIGTSRSVSFSTMVGKTMKPGGVAR